MKVVEQKIINENKYFFKIKDFMLYNEMFNIEVVALLSKDKMTIDSIESLNVENDLSVTPEDVEQYCIDQISENIDVYLRENPVF